MKKVISLILSFVIVVVSLSTSLVVYAREGECSKTYYMPRFASAQYGEIGSSSYKKLGEYANKKSTELKYKSGTYYTIGDKVYKTIKNGIVDRKKTINLCLAFTQSQTSSSLFSALKGALAGAYSNELSDSSIDGDYILWQLDSYRFYTGNVVGARQNNYYFYDIKMDFGYRTTAQQEKEVDKVVADFVASVDFSKLSDYQVVKKIHDFILDKTEYDYDAYKNINSSSNQYDYAFTAWGALVKGKSVCQGYALAFYRLAKELGYDTRFVYSDPKKGCHAWNMIELDGKFYYVDTTWDDQESFRYRQRYFLVNYDKLRANDSSFLWFNSGAHTLDPEQETTDFIENYMRKVSSISYDPSNTNLLSNYVISLGANSFEYSGSPIMPSVQIRDAYGNYVLTNNFDVFYVKNTNTGIAKVKISNMYGSATRQFFITPSTAFKPKTSSSTTNKIEFSYTPSNKDISGYVLYIYKNGGWKIAKDTFENKVTVSNLSPNSTYKFRVVEYQKINSNVYYSKQGATLTTCTKPNAPKISSLKPGKRTFNVKWGKVGCNKYQVSYSTNANMKNAKTVLLSNKALSKKVGGLQKGKKYYVRVRAVKIRKDSNNKQYKYYSAWSSKKSVVVK